MRQLCKSCAGDDQNFVLTSIHLVINGEQKTFYFHNLKDSTNCLQKWLERQKSLHNAAQN
jgi:hypothetical protein